MNMLASIKDYLQKKVSISSEKPVVEAYDIWSSSYDVQQGNLMLDLDSMIFSSFIKDIPLENKRIADIGCGTGRHWQKLYERFPVQLTGYDVSAGMLNQLRKKFPAAITKHITDNLMNGVPAGSVDCIISTLTIAHIKDINEAIASWSRILKNGGDLIITDFHPSLLEMGGTRSFKHENKSFAVMNYVHPLSEVKRIFSKYGFTVIKHEERIIDDTVRSYYEAQGRVDVFQKFKGMPVIYGLYLKK
jgi:ubiquinone/menaquinone biosynthesis C-methylase UbiE